MQPIVVVPFASEVHSKEYYLGIYDILRRYIVRYGVEVHNGVIVSHEDAEHAGRKYSESLPIAMTLTGGTSKLVETFADGGNFERLILFSHSEHNSLASAISARNKVERKGLMSIVYHCSDINSPMCISVIDRMFRVTKAVASVINSKVGVIADRSLKDEVEETFESRFKANIIVKPIDKFLNEMGSLDSAKVSEAKEYIVKKLGLSLSNDLESIARLYLALSSFVRSENLDAITIDCFPFILQRGVTPCIPLAILNSEDVIAGCEADIPSLLGMMLARAVTGRSGWMANVVDVVSNRCTLAHCTIALDISKNIKVLPHFETEKPYALAGEYVGDVVTLLSIDRDLTLATLALGKVISSGNLGLAACRTQMIVEFEYSVDLVPDTAPNNHHIIVAGDWRKELMEALYMLGIDVVDYKEFAV